ncbi:hypothetical protein KRMM14A1004_45680 [Krasilnikovia sp. MM14-A1004]
MLMCDGGPALAAPPPLARRKAMGSCSGITTPKAVPRHLDTALHIDPGRTSFTLPPHPAWR